MSVQTRDAFCVNCGEGQADAAGRCTRCRATALIGATHDTLDTDTGVLHRPTILTHRVEDGRVVAVPKEPSPMLASAPPSLAPASLAPASVAQLELPDDREGRAFLAALDRLIATSQTRFNAAKGTVATAQTEMDAEQRRYRYLTGLRKSIANSETLTTTAPAAKRQAGGRLAVSGLPAKAWGPGREQCLECGRSEGVQHTARGLCSSCYTRRQKSGTLPPLT